MHYLNIFGYGFMLRAFAAALCISVIAPCIGMVIVLKRLSAIGDATSHSALAGIAAGLAFGFNPVLGAVVFSVLAVFAVEGFRKAFGRYADLAPVVVLSAGVGLTAVFSGFISGSSANLNSFLFGSIVTVSNFEMYLTLGLSCAVLVMTVLLYRELFCIAFDEDAAKLSKVPVKTVNFIFMIMTAVTVSVASRTVGALMISSLMVIPVACAMTVAKSYGRAMVLSVMFALFFTVAGLFISFYVQPGIGDLKPGGTIVLTGIAVLVVLLTVKRRR